MSEPTPAEVATAFSTHRFEETYDRLAGGVAWELVGGPTLHGRQQAIEACESTLADLQDVPTTFDPLTVIDGGDRVVVDTVGHYQSADGVTRVASCDVFTFRDGLIVAIRSYTVELTEQGVS